MRAAPEDRRPEPLAGGRTVTLAHCTVRLDRRIWSLRTVSVALAVDVVESDVVLVVRVTWFGFSASDDWAVETVMTGVWPDTPSILNANSKKAGALQRSG